MSPVLRLSAVVCAAALALTACGSSQPKASTEAPASCSSPASPATTTATTGAPPVANATDLKKAPVPSAGTPPPPTHLVTVDLVKGTGPTAGAGSTVRVQYVGVNYADGKVFDSSWSRGQPVDFPLSGVIAGFAQGITGMKVCGRREVVIPPSLGYGAQGAGSAVGPNETLVFVIDLLKVT
ncbi:MAG TPA: FKBP-type peptidyl-prolyl cis-trans isomerase [Acidimicrobiales bacterium]|nr:FKBP-type peptidyl-prolyl cis-trans isomerase [Acidimicrobiales bacterium]